MTDSDLAKEIKKLAVAIISVLTSFVSLVFKFIQLVYSVLKIFYNKIAHELDLQRAAYPLRKQAFLTTLAPRLALYQAKLMLAAERGRRILAKLKNKPLKTK